MSNNKAMDFKCPGCGAPITYKIKSKNWKCDYCKSSFTLEEFEKLNKKKIKNENNKKNKIDDYNEYVKYFCKNCNAEIIADEQTASTFCIYCGNTAILKEKLSGKFAPSKIIPFKKDKQEAIDAFVNLSKGRPFIAPEFNNKNNIEKITGVYIPFWLYDIKTHGIIDAHATDTSSWVSGSRTYVRTKEYNCIREANVEFDKIPIDASTRFDNTIMNSIEPFNYSEMEQYNHAYLSGHLAEKYDDDPLKTEDIAKTRALNTLEELLRSSISSNHENIKVKNKKLEVLESSNEYVLLPVWMVNVKYGNKMYPFAMNAQTGKFIGNIPVNKKKVALVSLAMIISISLITIFIFYLVYLFGGN